MFAGETMDKVPTGSRGRARARSCRRITVFWLVHILPEKVAEKKRHPQAKAIQVLCLLSLVFGGLLWPLAWLWAYSKPVMYKMAYGTDVSDEHHGETPTRRQPAPAPRRHELRSNSFGHASRSSRRRPAGGSRLMELILLLIYSFFAWLVFFKFKWLPWNITTQVITVTIPIIGITILILFLNIAAPPRPTYAS